MSDASEAADVSALFARLCELAEADGAVPDDGSGIDGVWTRTIIARDRRRSWNVAMNADTDTEHTIGDYPREGMNTSVPAGKAVVHLGAWPAGVVGPTGGELAVENTPAGLNPIEPELLGDVRAAIRDAGGDLDAEEVEVSDS